MDISIKHLELQQLIYDRFKSQNAETGLFDVTFEVEGKILYAHKNMLNLISPTFASMLSDRWISNKEAPIKIQGYSYDDFYQFITYLYCGKCELTDVNIYSMVDMAEFYGVNLFKNDCDIYAAAMEMTNENIFKLIELAEKYSMTKLKASIKRFLAKNFAAVIESDVFLTLEKSVAKEFVINHKGKAEQEILFEAVYKWCEGQAMEKQSADPSLTLNETIKEEMSDFIPIFNFRFMKYNFLFEFVAPRGLILYSLNELSKIMCDRLSQPLVRVRNSRGEALYGNIIPDENVIEHIKSLTTGSLNIVGDLYCWWSTKCKIPSTPSPLKKRDDIKWFLVCFTNGHIGVVRGSDIKEGHYLLAELTATTSRFKIEQGCTIEIEPKF